MNGVLLDSPHFFGEAAHSFGGSARRMIWTYLLNVYKALSRSHKTQKHATQVCAMRGSAPAPVSPHAIHYAPNRPRKERAMLSDRELQMKINKFLSRKTQQYPALLDADEAQGPSVHLGRQLYT